MQFGCGGSNGGTYHRFHQQPLAALLEPIAIGSDTSAALTAADVGDDDGRGRTNLLTSTSTQKEKDEYLSFKLLL